MVYITRRETFNAAHKLYNPNWSAEQNKLVFGKCANKNWHGHNYALFVTVKGTPSKDTGFIMNIKELSQIIQKEVIEKLDHKNLNLDVEFIPEDVFPSTENLAILIWQQLEPHITECKLHAIKLYETENIYAEYFGE
ncbi:MAG: 6-carboxytetrahydropterin synthase [Chitinophagales bacterium]|nr:6-carboxytetrahydropterin synthase [Chitinophagales bacterium]